MIPQLRAKGIQFAERLTESEFRKIEEIYDIKFPESLRKFYSLGVPFSDRFPLWNDFSDANIEKIKERIVAPIKWLLIYVEKDGYWLTGWGKRPDSTDESIEQFWEIALQAPKLIPIYSHRYMPQLDGVDDPPVISTVGQDTIYYGGNLEEYLQNEFLKEKPFSMSNCIYIPFWSDIIRRHQIW